MLGHYHNNQEEEQMEISPTELNYARDLDAGDRLATFRDKFYIPDENLIYLDGNSLGRLPKETVAILNQEVSQNWGDQLIRSWNANWIQTSRQAGDKIARLIGASPGEVLVSDSTSVNLFKLVLAALQARVERRIIVSDVFNFPSDLYVIQGITQLLNNGHQIKMVPSDDGVSIPINSLENAIDSDTALVYLTHVSYRNAFMYDMQSVTELAHRRGSHILWDLSHSTGAVRLELNQWNVDLAVGCTYKYLNSGPGAPAFLYIRKDLQDTLVSPIWGWFGAKEPFKFALDYQPALGIDRFQTGTPPILSMKAIEPAADIILDAGIDNIREKSIMQTEYLISLTDLLLKPLGFEVISPRDSRMRGSHISLRHNEAYRICQAMINPRQSNPIVIPDFRAPDLIRLGISPLYNTFSEINLAVHRIKTIVETGTFHRFSKDWLPVT
jgi:kynureninase